VGLEHREPTTTGPGADRSRPAAEAHHAAAARDGNDTTAGIGRDLHRRELWIHAEYDRYLDGTAARVCPDHRRMTPAQSRTHLWHFCSEG
jgi:hypothetical protein